MKGSACELGGIGKYGVMDMLAWKLGWGQHRGRSANKVRGSAWIVWWRDGEMMTDAMGRAHIFGGGYSPWKIVNKIWRRQTISTLDRRSVD